MIYLLSTKIQVVYQPISFVVPDQTENSMGRYSRYCSCNMWEDEEGDKYKDSMGLSYQSFCKGDWKFVWVKP